MYINCDFTYEESERSQFEVDKAKLQGEVSIRTFMNEPNGLIHIEVINGTPETVTKAIKIVSE